MEIQLSDHFTYKKLLQFTVPSIVMMISTSIYSMVDGFFVSNFAGKTPYAAVNLMMPFLTIMATVGLMLGTGGSAIVAKAFGEGDDEKANQTFSLCVYTAFILGAVLAVVGIILIEPIAALLGAEGELLHCCTLYGSVILAVLPFFILQMMFQSFFVTAEKPQLGLIMAIVSGVVNIVLDAILILLLPQKYKLLGAAVATGFGQFLGGVLPLIYFFRKNDSILRLGKTHFDKSILLKACANGSSECMNNIAVNIVSMLYNLQLMKYVGENGIVAYGVMMYVSFVFSSTFIGYTIGVSPVISYHDGAQNHNELKNLLKKSTVLVGVFGIAMMIVGQLLAFPLAKLFVGYDPELMTLTVAGFRIFALSFLFMGYGILGSGFFTALNDGIVSAVISFLRSLVFQIAAVLILPVFFDVDGIWVSIVAAEFMAMLLSAVIVVAKRKKYHYL